MNYKPFKPNWTYTKINIDEINQINEELINLFWEQYNPEDNVFAIGFLGETADQIWDKLPLLKAWLEKNNLLRERWMSYFYSITEKKEFPIHIDYFNDDRFIAFNFPLINCENTYTAWYNATVNEKSPFSAEVNEDGTLRVVNPEDHGKEKSNDSYWCVQETAKEIDRTLCDSPMIINTSIPHRPISTHNRLRVLFSMRLAPADFEKDVQPFIDQCQS